MITAAPGQSSYYHSTSAPVGSVGDRIEVTGGSAPGGLTDLPRAVLSAAVGVMNTVERVVIGDDRVRTARSNAWEAICADQARAYERDEVRRLVAAIVERPVERETVG